MKEYIWTPTARKTADALLKILREMAGKAIVIILTGFSGVGKSALLRAMSQEIAAAGATVVDGYRFCQLEVLHHTVIVVEDLEGANRTEEYISGQGWPQCRRIVMPGLRSEEVKQILSAQGRPITPLCDLFAITLGNMRLLEIALKQEFTQAQAMILAAEYLGKNLSSLVPHVYRRWSHLDPEKFQMLAAPYVQIDIPQQVLDQLPKRTQAPGRFLNDRIYSRLSQILECLATAKRIQPSPFLLAQKSEQVLNQMTEGQWACYEALACNVPQEYVEEFTHLFGDDENQPREGGRLDCFGATLGKAGVVARFNQAVVQRHEEIDYGQVDSDEQAFMNVARTLHMSLDNGSIFVHKHAHTCFNIQVQWFAWAFESWAQQRGLEYVVKNMAAEKSYRYHPKENRLEFVDFKVRS